jgi:hypothetical protein
MLSLLRAQCDQTAEPSEVMCTHSVVAANVHATNTPQTGISTGGAIYRPV